MDKDYEIQTACAWARCHPETCNHDCGEHAVIEITRDELGAREKHIFSGTEKECREFLNYKGGEEKPKALIHVPPDGLSEALKRLSAYIAANDVFSQNMPVGITFFASGKMLLSYSLRDSRRLVSGPEEAARIINEFIEEAAP